MGRLLASTLNDKETHSISILSRNKFLASTPTKVSEAFGWLGESLIPKEIRKVWIHHKRNCIRCNWKSGLMQLRLSWN